MSRLTEHVRDWFGPWLAIITLIVGGLGTLIIELAELPLDKVQEQSLVLTASDGRWLHVRVTNGYYRVKPQNPINDNYRDLLLAYEDRRFWDHPGVDWLAIARASIENLKAGGVASGASTITMQVSRLLKPHKRTIPGKLRQALGALWLEKHFSKRQILDFYYLLAPFGGNVEGVEMASHRFFGKSAQHLTIAEAALLVAIPQSPNGHSPLLNPTRSKLARDRVLRKGFESELLTEEIYLDATHSPLPTQFWEFPKMNHHLADRYQIFRESGYVHTHLDFLLQQNLNTLARNWTTASNENIGIVILGKTGELKGHLGSSDYFDDRRAGALDFTAQIRSPGSTLKPLIYGLGETRGVLRYEEVYLDQDEDFGGYSPQNFDRSNRGLGTLGDALIRSDNRAAVEGLRRIGPRTFQGMLESTGAQLFGDIGLPVAVGGVGIKLMDLCQLYTAFLNAGAVQKVRYLKTERPTSSEFLEPKAAHRTSYLLTQVKLPNGLRRASARTNFALKTGTGPRGSDALTIWYDSEQVICAWLGSPDNAAQSANSVLEFILACKGLSGIRSKPSTAAIR